MSKLSEQCKKTYVEFCARENRLVPLVTFVDASLNLIGRQLEYDRVKHWSLEEGWKDAASLALHGSEERKEIRYILNLAFSSAMNADDAKELIQYGKAYQYTLDELVDSELVDEIERMEGLRRHIKSFIMASGSEMGGNNLAGLTRLSAILHKRLMPLITMEGEGTVDPDAFILGIEETYN